jgi:hypothetical protein
MIIGNVSIDPRRVTEAKLVPYKKGFILNISIMYGNTLTDTQSEFADYEDALIAFMKLDDACYKGPLSDAIASERLEDEDSDDEQSKIGFK